MKHILLVDDEEPILDAFGEMLKNDYAVTKISSSVDALSKIKSGSFDLIITDIKMPDISGCQIAEKANAEKIPVMAFSAYINDENRKLFDFCVDKPLGGPVMIQIIQKIFGEPS